MRAAILWTGGKDSALALYKMHMAGHEIAGLITFAPKEADFLAHPIPFMKLQAQAMGMPHYEIVVDEPLEDAYENAIRSIKEKYRIDALVTGDIAEVNGLPNWIRERCKNIDIEVITPLWGLDRSRAFLEILSSGIRAIISCVKIGGLKEEWLGKELDSKALEELREISNKTGLDICGEEGEYHTLVIDGPLFRQSIVIGSYSKHVNDSMAYMRPQKITLHPKG